MAKPGAAQLAQLTGAELVGVFTLTPASAWTLKTWDGFLIPRPFSRILVTWPASAVPESAAVQAALDEGDHMAAAAPATA